MKYDVVCTCDGTTNKKLGVVISLVLTDTTFVESIEEPCYDVKSSTQTELLAVMHTLKKLYYAYRNKYTNILIQTDCIAIIKTYDSIMRDRDSVSKVRYSSTWKSVLRYAEPFNVDIKHSRGHLDGISEQKVCDTVGRLIRRCGMDLI